MRRFYLENPPISDIVLLNGDEARHITRVLRLKRGDEMVLFDGAGTAYSGVLTESHADGVTVQIRDTFEPKSSASQTVLMQAVLKSQKMDFIVQKSTELGCARIIPFFSSRCIPRWDADKGAQKQHHWQQIAIAAVKQSGVRRLPIIDQPCNFETALASAGDIYLKVLLWEDEQSASFGALMREKKPDQAILLIVGPEGGFSEAEVELARRYGFCSAGLGKTILRAETVPLTVLSIIGYETGFIG